MHAIIGACVLYLCITDYTQHQCLFALCCSHDPPIVVETLLAVIPAHIHLKCTSQRKHSKYNCTCVWYLFRRFLYYTTEGPYLISAEVGEKSVFWKVNESDQLTATESAADASLFYIIPAEDSTNPSDFHIAYWPDKARHGGTAHVDNLFRTHNKKGPPVPYYLSCDTNLFGQGKGTSPLTLKTTVKLRQARFCLHSRVQSSFFMCTSTPVSLNSWFESEQFFIKCSHHFFKIDGYIATMVSEAKSQLHAPKTSSQSQDPKTSSQSQESEECGLLQALKKKIELCYQPQAREQS